MSFWNILIHSFHYSYIGFTFFDQFSTDFYLVILPGSHLSRSDISALIYNRSLSKLLDY